MVGVLDDELHPILNVMRNPTPVDTVYEVNLFLKMEADLFAF